MIAWTRKGVPGRGKACLASCLSCCFHCCWGLRMEQGVSACLSHAWPAGPQRPSRHDGTGFDICAVLRAAWLMLAQPHPHAP